MRPERENGRTADRKEPCIHPCCTKNLKTTSEAVSLSLHMHQPRVGVERVNERTWTGRECRISENPHVLLSSPRSPIPAMIPQTTYKPHRAFYHPFVRSCPSRSPSQSAHGLLLPAGLARPSQKPFSKVIHEASDARSRMNLLFHSSVADEAKQASSLCERKGRLILSSASFIRISSSPPFPFSAILSRD